MSPQGAVGQHWASPGLANRPRPFVTDSPNLQGGGVHGQGWSYSVYKCPTARLLPTLWEEAILHAFYRE